MKNFLKRILAPFTVVAIVCTMGYAPAIAASGTANLPVVKPMVFPPHQIVNNFKAYHGLKYGDIDQVIANGIKRPASGSQGNGDDNWKGFYTTDRKSIAAGYATTNDPNDYRHAGAVIEVTFPGKTEIFDVTGSAEEIKRDLGIPASVSLLEGLDSDAFKEKHKGSDYFALKRPIAEGEEGFEYIFQWEQASRANVELSVRFDRLENGADNRRGEDDRQAFQTQQECIEGPARLAKRDTRSPRAVTGCSLSTRKGIDEGKATAQSTYDEYVANRPVPERPLNKNEISRNKIEQNYDFAVNTGRFRGLRADIDSKNMAVNFALNMAQLSGPLSSNQSAFDKMVALAGNVPGLGDLANIFDATEHDNKEQLIQSIVGLSAFVISLSIPVVGEAIEIGLLIEQVGEAIGSAIMNYFIGKDSDRPDTLPSPLEPQTFHDITASWLPDAKGNLGEFLDLKGKYGESIQKFALSVSRPNYSRPFTGFKVTSTPEQRFEPDLSRIIYRGRVVDMLCVANDITTGDRPVGSKEYRCRPSTSIILANDAGVRVELMRTILEFVDNTPQPFYGNFIHLHIGAIKKDNDDWEAADPINNHGLTGSYYLNFVFHARTDFQCFSNLVIHNGAWLGAFYGIRENGQLKSTGGPLGMGSRTRIDIKPAAGAQWTNISPLANGNQPVGGANQLGARADAVGPEIKGCSSSGETATLETRGGLFNARLVWAGS
ncbi:MAG: hypothetical protein L0G87_11185 [Renibacterium salmoninarum]|nr:hypothetical protein [Renibacterium salmoninarum]